MARYVAFLRGVSPMNAGMSELKFCFEQAGFGNVRTLLSSGNVVFDTPSRWPGAIARKAEASMQQSLDRAFRTFVRPVSYLRRLIEADPYAAFKIAPEAKRVVTFLHHPSTTAIALPLRRDEDRILASLGAEVFSVYIPSPDSPTFLRLVEKTFGSEVATRTWATMAKCMSA